MIFLKQAQLLNEGMCANPRSNEAGSKGQRENVARQNMTKVAKGSQHRPAYRADRASLGCAPDFARLHRRDMMTLFIKQQIDIGDSSTARLLEEAVVCLLSI